MFKNLVFVMVAVLCGCGILRAQNVFNPADVLVNYNAAAAPGSASNPNYSANVMTKWVRTPSAAWTTTNFKAYMWNGIAFRLRFPNNYNPANATKYPVVVFFHGGGEIGPVSDNEDQLLWGAQIFEQRINAGEWNGFLIFPQETAIGWNDYHFSRVNSILDTLQKYNNADADRVISMGLSSGGYGAIGYASAYPKRVAAALPSSPPQISSLNSNIPAFVHIPVWVANGGADLNPDPYNVQDFNVAFRNAGGNVYQNFYVTNGHNTWTDMWNMKNTAGVYISTSYWNSAHKAQPLTYFNNQQFCSGGPISARMGITAGFFAYEWQKDGATIAGATSNEYTATAAGQYRVRFMRVSGGTWSAWSPSPVVISTKTCASDTVYAEHFNFDRPFISAPEYSNGNFTCQGGIVTTGTNLFTQDAAGVQGGRFLVNYTKGGTGCALAAGDKVWNVYNPVTVKPNTSYELSFYTGNQSATSLAQLAPVINGTALTAGFVQATGTGNASWKKFTFTWNSGSATTADFGIINRSAVITGNEFTIDDISLKLTTLPLPACTANLLPANNAVLTTNATAALSWTAAANAASYDVFLWTGATAPVTPVANVTTTSYNASGLTGSTLYKWYVLPRNSNGYAPVAGCSANQTSFTTAVNPTPPSCATNTAPANGAVLATSATAALSWNAVATATSYDVYIWTGATAPVTPTANVATNTYNASGLTPSTLYNWYIAPRNAVGAATGCSTSGTSTFTTATSGAVPACVTNASPSNAAVLPSQTSARLNWPASAGATSYDVYLATGNAVPTVLVTNTTALTYYATGLTANTLYSWYIAPRNANGANTACGTSGRTTFTTAAATGGGNIAPVSNAGSNIAITLPQSSAVTNGSASYDPDGSIAEFFWYQIQAPVAVTISNPFSMTPSITGLTTAGTYIIGLQVKDNNGVTAYSQVSITVSPASTAPGCLINTSPANGSTVAGQTAATLTWPSVATAASYDVYLAAGSATPTTLVTNTALLTYNATGLTAGTLYSWYIVPRNAVGAATGCGANSTSFTTAVALPACVTNTSPANAAVVAGQNTATLTWPAAATATSYDVYLAAGSATPTTLVTNTASLTYNATGLTAGTLYSWYIAPRNAGGANTACGASNKTTFTTAAPTAAPACVANTSPANGSTIATQTTAVLTWPAAANATSYDVYLATGSGVPATLVTNTVSTTYNATGLTAGILYSWYIAPRNAVGAATGCGANTTTFTTASVPACVTNTSPANGSVLPSQTSARLNWPASAGAASYDVYLAAGSGVPAILVTNTTALTYYATNLTANTLYSWYIAPRNASGANTACGASNRTSFTTAAATGGGNIAPVSNAGSNITITLPVSSVVLNGSGTYDPDGSIVEFYWYVTQSPVAITISNPFSMTPTISGLTTAGTYRIDLQVKDNNGVTGYSEVVITVNSAARMMSGATSLTASKPAADTVQQGNSTALTVVSPNPVKPGQSARLRFSSDKSGAATVSIVNANGLIVSQQRTLLVKGINNIMISTGAFSQGFYIISVTGGSKPVNSKLLVR